jgi:hypothetical protein
MIHVYKDLFEFVSWDIQGLSELADQNNTVKSSSSGNNRNRNKEKTKRACQATQTQGK